MSLTVCLLANTLSYPNGGGHLWVYLNWALGLRALGCDVIWLEAADPHAPSQQIRTWATNLRHHLEPYGMGTRVALCSWTHEPLVRDVAESCLDVMAAAEAHLLLNLNYKAPATVVRLFQRTALIDIDPGLLQVWMSLGWVRVAPHDVHFTTGETVGRPGAHFPDGGREWQYTPPCVALDWWPPQQTTLDAPFTTVSHWYQEEWAEDAGEIYRNDKRSGFLPFLDLPKHTCQPLELALSMGPDEDEERLELQTRGWGVQDAYAVAPTPRDYQRYIWSSRGEFSCVKPSCIRLQNAWISDRTLCYLASGKPAVVQHTGPSRFLPDAAGLFRFLDIGQAAQCLDRVARDYERQSELARALAEEFFDARKVTGSVLERALA